MGKIDMTKLSQIYEEEKIEYANQKVREMALKMLRRDMDLIDIMEVTGMTKAELLRLQEEGMMV